MGAESSILDFRFPGSVFWMAHCTRESGTGSSADGSGRVPCSTLCGSGQFPAYDSSFRVDSFLRWERCLEETQRVFQAK